MNQEMQFSELESMMRIGQKGQQYWFAREIMGTFGYTNWKNFRAVIERARQSMENCDEGSSRRYMSFFKREVLVGRNTKQEIEDVLLSRYACYIIAMNSDPYKAIIAKAQAFFAQQVLKAIEQQKILDQLGISAEEIDLKVLEAMKKQDMTSRDALVSFKMFQEARDNKNIDARTLLLITQAMDEDEKK